MQLKIILSSVAITALLASSAVAANQDASCKLSESVIGTSTDVPDLCQACKVSGKYLQASCQNNQGKLTETRKKFYPQCILGIRADNAILRCWQDKTKYKDGSFNKYCKEVMYDEVHQMITAVCNNKKLKIDLRYCVIGDLAYENGNLVCKNIEGGDTKGGPA